MQPFEIVSIKPRKSAGLFLLNKNIFICSIANCAYLYSIKERKTVKT